MLAGAQLALIFCLLEFLATIRRFEMEGWTNEELQRVFSEVARRAAIDHGFRVLALKNSTAAIAQVTSRPLPKGVTFRFVDNSGPHKTIPLPDPVPGISEELSDVELENVAGGDVSVSGGWSKLVHPKHG
jgi:hypothetical protein